VLKLPVCATDGLRHDFEWENSHRGPCGWSWSLLQWNWWKLQLCRMLRHYERIRWVCWSYRMWTWERRRGLELSSKTSLPSNKLCFTLVSRFTYFVIVLLALTSTSQTKLETCFFLERSKLTPGLRKKPNPPVFLVKKSFF